MKDIIKNMSNPADKASMLSMVRNLEGEYRFTILKKRKRRSDAQNAYLWGVVYPYIGAGLQEAWGETLTDDEVHEFLKWKFLAKPVVNRTTGELQGHTFPSTANLDTQEFIRYTNEIAKFAAESLNVVIPEPGELVEVAA